MQLYLYKLGIKSCLLFIITTILGLAHQCSIFNRSTKRTAQSAFSKKLEIAAKRVRLATQDLQQIDDIKAIDDRLNILLASCDQSKLHIITDAQLNQCSNATNEARHQLAKFKIKPTSTSASLKRNALLKAKLLHQAVIVARKKMIYNSENSSESSLCDEDNDSDNDFAFVPAVSAVSYPVPLPLNSIVTTVVTHPITDSAPYVVTAVTHPTTNLTHTVFSTAVSHSVVTAISHPVTDPAQSIIVTAVSHTVPDSIIVTAASRFASHSTSHKISSYSLTSSDQRESTKPYQLIGNKYFPWTSSLINQMESLGFVRFPIGGDGNCLFRALAHQLEGNDDNHMALRQNVCDYLEEHSAYWENVIPFAGFSRYVSRMRHSGRYGDEHCIVAFAKQYSVCVNVHQMNLPPYLYNYGIQDIHIVFNSRYHHYDSVVRIE